jgi:hypothetical protein
MRTSIAMQPNIGEARSMVQRISKLLVLSLVLASACAEDDTINRVQVNVVEKSVFDGSWYMSRTVIDVDYEGAELGTFPGDAASDFGEASFSAIPRIRWVIDEDYLYAYRDYELISGVDGAPREPGAEFGQPVAAYAVQSHFDIKRAYNPITGEQQNLIIEDTQDRDWYEREFMRVDWSLNHLPGYYGQIHDLYAVLGLWVRESTPLYVQTNSDWPDSWAPTFTRMSCASLDDTSANCDSRDRDWSEDYEQNELYHISFVQQDLLSPGLVPDPFSGQNVNWCQSVYGDAPLCTSHAVYTRTSFLKVSETREYEPTNWVDTRFDRHGYFRLEQPTYDRSLDANDNAYFQTDFLNYSINRHNIWRDWHDEAGNPIPYTERPVRQIVWYTTPELPAHLVKPSMAIASAWNEPVMATVRALRGQEAAVYPRQNCQTAEPDGYCFCQADPVTGETINPTCAGQYDPFLTPEEHIAAGAIAPFDCWVAVPDGAEPDMNKVDLTDTDFYGWYGATFQGEECVNILRMNACHRQAVEANGGTVDGLRCEERGDMRFKFMSYVDQPGTSFLGIATLRGDPVTGEILVGDANIGGPALDGYRTSALQEYDLINGNINEQELLTGEDVRDYLQSLNQVDLPAPPRVDFNVASLNAGQRAELTQLNQRMDRTMERIEQLRGPEGRHNIFSDRVAALAGTDIEARLTDNMETYALAGFKHLPTDMNGAAVPEGVLEMASPFRVRAMDRLNEVAENEYKIGRANVHMPNEYIDNSVIHFVNNHRDWSRARLEFELNRHLYFETELHEMGHCMGMRHQFTGSADNQQYFNDYYLIDDRFPLPDPADFDIDPTPGLSVEEQTRYEDAYRTARQNREQAGIDRWMNTSTMEYTATWYERVVAQTGHYDLATIMMGYGDVVEVYDNRATGLAVTEINPANTPRVYAKWYMGGESCTADTECPYSAGGAQAGLLLPGNLDAGLTQTCQPRTDGVPGSICSNFDDDANAMTAAAPNPPFVAVNYMFCTDERATGLSTAVGTLGVCNRYDEGDSFREIVRNVADSYERMYLWTNFRRYRSSFDIGPYLNDRLIGRRMIILQNLYQNLVYRYASDPEFRTQEGPYGFYDQFMASADILNFYARMLGQPDVGQYTWNADWERYERTGPDWNNPSAQLSVPIGMGRYAGSVYQRGNTGIYRVERIGTFYDKWFVLDLMTSRGMGYHRFSSAQYGQDVPFYANMYDVFPLEMQQIFSGMIRDEPSEYMPRIQCTGTFPRCQNPRLVYMDFYRGDCSPGSTTCRPDPIDVTYRDDLVLNGGGNIILQIYAALYGLAEFPTFFDTTFANQLFVCREGNGDCPEPGADAVEGVDFVRYTSERYGQNFMAYQVEPTSSAVNQTSIGFELIKEARDLSFILQMLRTYRGDFEPGSPDPSLSFLTAAQRAQLDALGYELPPAEVDPVSAEIERVYGRILDLESFFNQLIQLERQMGVGSYLGF